MIFCILSLVGAMGIMQNKPINVTGMYGTILLHEDAGGYVLVAVISFTVAVVITALCIKFRKKDKRVRMQKIMYKEQTADRLCAAPGGGGIHAFVFLPIRYAFLYHTCLPSSFHKKVLKSQDVEDHVLKKGKVEV